MSAFYVVLCFTQPFSCIISRSDDVKEGEQQVYSHNADEEIKAQHRTLGEREEKGSVSRQMDRCRPTSLFYFCINNTLLYFDISFLSFFFFLTWTIFKVFVEFVTILLLFYVLVFWPLGMWDLSSPARDWTRITCTGRQSLNHWTAREVPTLTFLCQWKYLIVSFVTVYELMFQFHIDF